MSKFTDLIVWQKARSLCLDIYRITESFPVSEQFGLSSQMRRAAVSVVSNIAEGADRGSDKETKQFMLLARGSLAELQTQLLIAEDLGFVEQADFKSVVDDSVEVHKMLNGFIKSLTRNSKLEAHG